jgi:hypothetical protein
MLYSTSQKVTDLVLDEVTGFFNLANPSSSIIALGWNQPLTEIFWQMKGKWQVSLTKLLPFISLISGKCAIHDASQPYGPPQLVKGNAFLFLKT